MEDSAKVNLEDLRKSKDFCEWLKKQDFSDVVVKAFKKEDMNGPAFLDCTEHDFKEMAGLTKGPIKNLLRLQKRHKPDQTPVRINNDPFDFNTRKVSMFSLGHNIIVLIAN